MRNSREERLKLIKKLDILIKLVGREEADKIIDAYINIYRSIKVKV